MDLRAHFIEEQFTFLEDNNAVHREWQCLLVTHSVSGVQVHDARLIAVMHVHRVGCRICLPSTRGTLCGTPELRSFIRIASSTNSPETTNPRAPHGLRSCRESAGFFLPAAPGASVPSARWLPGREHIPPGRG